MIFSINESGDLDLDKRNNTFCDYVADTHFNADFKNARSTIITYFKHKDYFKKDFILYKRNNYKDEEIRNMIQTKLDKLFSVSPNILNKIGFSFINNGDTFIICFYYKVSETENRNLLYDTIAI